jgi:Tfp pilus assembly protein PilE
MTNFVVERVLKTLHDLNRSQTFLQDDITYLEKKYGTVEEAKSAIKQDKQKNGETYFYVVTDDSQSGNTLISHFICTSDFFSIKPRAVTT